MVKVYKIAICDDEIMWCNELKSCIDQYFMNRQIEVDVDVFESAEAFMATDLNYDILFLDIELPEMSGIELKNKLRHLGKNINIVFVTNYEQYMEQAFGLNVLSYIYKSEIHRIPEILSDLEKSYLYYDFIEVSGHRINSMDIVYLTGQGSYTEVIMNDGSKLLCSIAISSFLDRLDCAAFIRIHKSFVVNMKYVLNFDYKNVELQFNHCVTLARSHSAEFKERYFSYLKNR